MPSRIDLQQLAAACINEAEVLLNNGLPKGAFYLAGYAVETALKAAICQNLNIDDLFTSAEVVNKTKELNTAFDKRKVHDFNVLIAFAGLYQELKDKTGIIFDSWSVILQMKWDEQCRYHPTGRKWKKDIDLDESNVRDFINDVNL